MDHSYINAMHCNNRYVFLCRHSKCLDFSSNAPLQITNSIHSTYIFGQQLPQPPLTFYYTKNLTNHNPYLPPPYNNDDGKPYKVCILKTHGSVISTCCGMNSKQYISI